MDVDPLEDSLVEIAPAEIIGFQVVLLRVTEQLQTVVEVASYRLFAQFELVDLRLGRRALPGDTGLLALELVRVDRIGIERIEDLLAISF